MPESQDKNSTLVADGAQRYVETPEYREAARAIEAEVTAAYADRLRDAGWLSGVFLRVACRQEIRRRIENLAPPQALYLDGAP